MNSELQKEEFLKLENRIWKTYQSRIKASTRILKESKYLDFLSAYYTIALSILSVFSLIYPDSIIGYFTAALSIVVMGMVFYGNSMNLSDRHINMKDNYLKLGDLYYKCLEYKINNNFNIDDIYKEYSKLLNKNENHTNNDYRNYLFHDQTERKNMAKSDIIIYIFASLAIKVGLIIIFLIPIILFILSVITIIK